MTVNFDPNLTLCGRMADQLVRLTFGMWDARKTIEVSVGGNCNGMAVIEAAVSTAYEELDGGEIAEITLSDEKGEEVLCCDDEGRGEEWLQDMLLAAEILSITPAK